MAMEPSIPPDVERVWVTGSEGFGGCLVVCVSLDGSWEGGARSCVGGLSSSEDDLTGILLFFP